MSKWVTTVKIEWTRRVSICDGGGGGEGRVVIIFSLFSLGIGFSEKIIIWMRYVDLIGSILLYIAILLDRNRDLFIVWIKLFQFTFDLKFNTFRIFIYFTIKIILLGNFDVLDIELFISKCCFEDCVIIFKKKIVFPNYYSN